MQKPKIEIEKTIAERSAKLERLKPLISLKTYDALLEKLSVEQTISRGANKNAEIVAEKRGRLQVLPKTLFTQRSLPRKAIRID